ncbi:MAG: hypothetical protein KDE55_21135 [Novosphingobium sp.]|nr:hypothetical protein [Novosphingobium sp.]
MGFEVGSDERLTGNVTTLMWIGPRPPRDIERNLGFAPGRLSEGYLVCLLKERLQPEDFEFDGTTLRSGGRLGLPASTEAADKLRTRVHDEAIRKYGAKHYETMQKMALQRVQLAGPQRIAKVLPTIRHSHTIAPDVQYPMGGGGLQWNILAPGKKFLIAMHVDPNGMATLPSFSVHIGRGAPYENKAKVMRYLQSA